MWSKIDVNNTTQLERWLEINRAMDERYKGLQLGDVRAAMSRRQGEAWYYQLDGVEAAMFFQYSAPRGHWQVLYVGYTGSESADEGTELIVAKMRDFMSTHGVSYLVGVKPPSMEDRVMQQIHNLLPAYPNLRVVVDRVVQAGEVWKLEDVPT